MFRKLCFSVLLISSLSIHLSIAQPIAKQYHRETKSMAADKNTCPDHVRLAVWFDGAHFTWEHHHKIQLFEDGRFEIHDQLRMVDRQPNRKVTIEGNLTEKESHELISFLQKEQFFSLQNKYGEDLGPLDGPSPWYISFCMDGKSKTIMSGFSDHFKEDPKIEKIIKKVNLFFKNQLKIRGITLSHLS